MPWEKSIIKKSNKRLTKKYVFYSFFYFLLCVITLLSPFKLEKIRNIAEKKIFLLIEPIHEISRIFTNFAYFIKKNEDSENFDLLISQLHSARIENTLLKYKMYEYKEIEKFIGKRLLNPEFSIIAKIIGKLPFKENSNVLVASVSYPHNIVPGDIAMGYVGVIGRVVHVGKSFIHILPLTSSFSRFSVSTSKCNFIIYGSGENNLKTVGLNENFEKVNNGEIVRTSGLSDVCPDGLNIGFVNSTTKEGLIVKPAENLKDIKYAVIIKFR